MTGLPGRATQTRSPTIEPTVPGANGTYPTPSDVASPRATYRFIWTIEAKRAWWPVERRLENPREGSAGIRMRHAVEIEADHACAGTFIMQATSVTAEKRAQQSEGSWRCEHHP